MGKKSSRRVLKTSAVTGVASIIDPPALQPASLLSSVIGAGAFGVGPHSSSHSEV